MWLTGLEFTEFTWPTWLNVAAPFTPQHIQVPHRMAEMAEKNLGKWQKFRMIFFVGKKTKNKFSYLHLPSGYLT